MYVIITSFLVFLVVSVAFVYFGGFRFAHTALLVVLADKYERTIPGAPTILILGDSTGYGTGASNARLSVAGRIGTDFPSYTIENRSKNGRTIKEALVELESIPETKLYALILIQIGGNDILQKRPLSLLASELPLLLKAARLRSPHVVMMTSGNVGGAPRFTGETALTYERLTRELRTLSISSCADAGASYVDLFLEPEDDIIAADPKRYLAKDGLHPSDEGYGVWYETLKPTLVEKLTQ